MPTRKLDPLPFASASNLFDWQEGSHLRTPWLRQSRAKLLGLVKTSRSGPSGALITTGRVADAVDQYTPDRDRSTFTIFRLVMYMYFFHLAVLGYISPSCGIVPERG